MHKLNYKLSLVCVDTALYAWLVDGVRLFAQQAGGCTYYTAQKSAYIRDGAVPSGEKQSVFMKFPKYLASRPFRARAAKDR